MICRENFFCNSICQTFDLCLHLTYYSCTCVKLPVTLHIEMWGNCPLDSWFVPFADMQRYESAMSWRAHDGEVYSVEFSYDENTVFSIGEDGKVCEGTLWRTDFQKVFWKLWFVHLNVCLCTVHPVEHSSLRREAVGADFTSGCHWALCAVRVQWIQTGDRRYHGNSCFSSP